MTNVTTNTLRGISAGLGLNPSTLGIVRARAIQYGEPVPEPVGHQGANQGVAVYDVAEVEAWYVARTIDPKPVRGPDKTQRKSRTK